MKESILQGLIEDSLITNLQKWIRHLDSAKRFNTPVSQHNVGELKNLLVNALERIEENERSRCGC